MSGPQQKNLIVDVITAKNLIDQVEGNVKSSRVIRSTAGTVAGFVNLVASSIGGGDAGTPKISVLRLWSHGWTHYADGGEYRTGT